MTYNPNIHKRHSIRLKDYDYSQTGAYFVTICTHERECLFGEVADGLLVHNDSGKIIEDVWRRLKERFPMIELDASIIMPNHLHGIVVINSVGALLAAPGINGQTKSIIHKTTDTDTSVKQDAASSAPTLGKIMRVFKSVSAIAVNRTIGRQGRPLWQRNYYEHIIRSDEELNSIRQYIIDNPLKWETDEENPTRPI